jgi:DNA-directed RNA polymerase specialized sigma24 family protein
MEVEALPDKKPLDAELVQAGLLALQVALREDAIAASQGKGPKPRSTEEILADVGFSTADIARVTGRPYEAVKTKLRRARARAAKTGSPIRAEEDSGGEVAE